MYSHISAPINVKFGTVEQTFVYRGKVSPLQGEKPVFRLTKNNTGMAARGNKRLIMRSGYRTDEANRQSRGRSVTPELLVLEVSLAR